MKQYVSIDIGGTAIKYGIIDENGIIIEHHECPTEAHLGGNHILEKAVSIVAECNNQYELSGICISTAGMVDIEKGEIFYAAPLIPDYAGTQFKSTMETTFGLPCEVENDVNCAGLAEAKCGAAQDSKVALCLTIGTGIGGCILIDGNVFHGASGSACEVGYMHMDDSDFQTLGATSILCRRVEEQKAAVDTKAKGSWNGKKIFEMAKAGDVICIEAIDEMVNTLGKGIANICYVLNPDTIVLGGGVMAQKEYLLPRLEEKVKTYLVSSMERVTTVKTAQNGNQAGMLGAFYHFQGRHQ